MKSSILEPKRTGIQKRTAIITIAGLERKSAIGRLGALCMAPGEVKRRHPSSRVCAAAGIPGRALEDRRRIACRFSSKLLNVLAPEAAGIDRISSGIYHHVLASFR